jgi:hypothetical protein
MTTDKNATTERMIADKLAEMRQWTLCEDHGTGSVRNGECTVCRGDRALIQVVAMAEVARLTTEECLRRLHATATVSKIEELSASMLTLRESIVARWPEPDALKAEVARLMSVIVSARDAIDDEDGGERAWQILHDAAPDEPSGCPECEGYRHNKRDMSNDGWCPTCCNSDGTAKTPTPQYVPRGHCNRCDRCGWLLRDDPKLGCVLGNCSQRPSVDLRTTCAGCQAPFAPVPAQTAEPTVSAAAHTGTWAMGTWAIRSAPRTPAEAFMDPPSFGKGTAPIVEVLVFGDDYARLVVNGHGVAKWPKDVEIRNTGATGLEYANECARVLSLALASGTNEEKIDPDA